MLKAVDFSWSFSFLALNFLGFFACQFLVFLNCCYFFFFFYSCTVVATGTTITITSNNISEGEGTSEKPMTVVTASFCKLKLSISFTCLLSMRRISTH